MESCLLRSSANSGPCDAGADRYRVPRLLPRRTETKGRYLGIHDDGMLLALSGERMDFGDLREASAVCTHPYYTGRGTAPVLVRQVMQGMQEEGVTPLLHVGGRNARANGWYEALGLCACANCGMRSVS